MPEKTEQERIDELVAKIDAFMVNGGGRMNVKGGEGDAQETLCTSCCGEFADDTLKTPAGSANDL